MLGKFNVMSVHGQTPMISNLRDFWTTNKDMDFQGQTFELITFGSKRRSCPGVSLAFKMVHFLLGRFLHS
ncbi:hypothetical protein Golob_027627 [Gossypium lobatum]|uniref:Cytochrome P450 n=1 Tax=Gossypium lobatum TaxID=34289 RepID=A0A7J8NDS0_9ROSI|nr:hypothetical protein [Gossypium lobatum]